MKSGQQLKRGLGKKTTQVLDSCWHFGCCDWCKNGYRPYIWFMNQKVKKYITFSIWSRDFATSINHKNTKCCWEWNCSSTWPTYTHVVTTLHVHKYHKNIFLLRKMILYHEEIQVQRSSTCLNVYWLSGKRDKEFKTGEKQRKKKFFDW